MNNILVTGAKGQLGSEIRELSILYTDYNFFFKGSVDLDITDFRKVNNFIEDQNIDIIINCAAYTAVDNAESNYELANKINNLAVKNLAEIAKERSIKLIHISTDYVFDGNSCKPYLESDIVNPKSIYGKTKLFGEKAILTINPNNSIIIRTSWVYSKYGNNFVNTMLNLAKNRTNLNVVYDQVGTPTLAKDLAKVILNILKDISNKKVEIYHYSNLGVCSWYDLAQAIFEITKKPMKLKPVRSSEYPSKVARPFYSVLDKKKIIEKYKVEIPYWRKSLKEFLLQ